MTVSADGIMKCLDNCDGGCKNILNLPTGPFILEMKCPYSGISNKEILPVQYSCPHYYLQQVLSEMKACGSSIAMFASCSPESLAMSYIDFSDDKWDKLWNLTLELFNVEKVSLPTQVNPESIKMKEELKSVSGALQLLAVEVPTLECVDTKRYENIPNVNNPMYRFRPPYPPSNRNVADIREAIVECGSRSMETIREAHDLCRRKASEVLLFLLTDTDREYNKDKPSSIPIAYALKGKSLKTSVCRSMMNQVRNVLNDNKIQILVEAYDGQWANLVFRGQNNEPLTLFELQRDVWLTFATMSKDNLLKFIDSVSISDDNTIKEWSEMNILREGVFRYGNIRTRLGIHTKETQDLKHCMHCKRYLSVESFCNEFNSEGGISMIKFPTVNARPFLWQVHISDRNMMHIWGKRKLQRTSLTSSEGTDTHDIDTNVSDEIETMEHDLVNAIATDSDTQPADSCPNFLPTDVGHIRNILLTEKNNIMIEILFFLLCGKRTDKWAGYDESSLYDNVLNSAEHIYTELTIYELDGILKILQRSASPQCPLKIHGKHNKLAKSNYLAFLLGQNKRYFPPRRKRIIMKSLKELCKLEIRRSVPEEVIRVGLAIWKFNIDLNEWMDNSPVPLTFEIPVEPFSFDIFSYPDISVTRSSVESRIIGPSHCLTNLRIHATQKGFFGCSPKAFWRVSEADNSILNKAFLVEPIPDKQSVPSAQRMFSSEVEQTMRNNADLKEAELVKHIRNWYDACNKRGLTLPDRIKYLIAMHNYMLSFYDPSYFPMRTTHVAGLPSTTFQAILQNISTRIQLYHLSAKKSYNHRAISTLAVESMFSTLATLCPNSCGIPLAAKIPHYIAKVTQFNAIQCNPMK